MLFLPTLSGLHRVSSTGTPELLSSWSTSRIATTLSRLVFYTNVYRICLLNIPQINPRIQVEHTITEEVTGIDIVAAQIQIAAGASLEQLGLTQDHISTRGFAFQCRITTEDPAQSFAPDTGKIEVYRSAGGNGVRLDGGNGFAGAIITRNYYPPFSQIPLLTVLVCSSLRLHVGQVLLPWFHIRDRPPKDATCSSRVPYPWRQDQHPLLDQAPHSPHLR